MGMGLGMGLGPGMGMGGKHYPVLEDNLQHLHEIHESIQQMRDLSVQAYNSQLMRSSQYSRLSSSCPSLAVDPGSDPDLLSSVNSSPIQAPNLGLISSHMTAAFNDIMHRKGSASKEWLWRGVGFGSEVSRRRSWTALEDLSNGKVKRKSSRQRSMSLSSMDSEAEDPFIDVPDSGGGLLLTDGTTCSGPGHQSGTAVGGRRSGVSTHSLNEADLQNDFAKIQAKREAESRLMPARLPLQKSVSTPSIIAVRDLASATIQHDGAAPAIQPFVCARLGDSGQRLGTESETEEEETRLIPATSQLSLHHLLADPAYDNHAEKRRKRGSLFFRKKKDKKKVPHQWVSVCYVSPHTCDWCAKALTNKPAFCCDNCSATVHQTSCKDHIQDCKGKTSKNAPKSGMNIMGHAPVNKQPNEKKKSLTSVSLTSNSSSRRTTLCYSPWRRVAAKLGVNQIISEEKDHDGSHMHDTVNYSDEVPLVQYEFLDESPVTASELELDPVHGLQAEEPDSWTPTVSKEVTKKLKEKEIKRQEHMYEFILTEKHHCLTLRVMQKVFVEGLQKHFQLGPNLARMFPRLADLTEIHLEFLAKLREKQRASPVIDTLSDILLEQFSGDGASRLKACYGEFCSRHRDAVNMYKYYLQHDRRFGEFVKHCQGNPLLKKKGIPECILFVTQRLTKYPLLIEPLIKTSKDNKMEQEKLHRALALVKEILVEVDAQVAEQEKEDRKLEIYHKIDAKSFTLHRGRKFKKSDILADSRKLRFEGVAMLMQGRSKMQVVLVIVLSDVLFFLLENNQKYSFFTPDNKAGVISLQKLLVREKAGQESRGIYLISSNPADPEMFELKVHKPKDKQTWIQAVRAAVQCCPEDEEDGTKLSQEAKQKLFDAKQEQIRQIVGILRQKDVEQALILEEKMALQQQLAGISSSNSTVDSPSYCHLVSEDMDSPRMWQEVLRAIREVNRLASSLYVSGTNLSRSVSSVGEHQSSAYVSPTLPKRAETFGGFDNANKDKEQGTGTMSKVLKKPQPAPPQVTLHGHSREPSISSSPALTPDSEAGRSSRPSIHSVESPLRSAIMATVPSGIAQLIAPPDAHAAAQISSSAPGELPSLISLGQEQQMVALQLSHHVYTLSSIISQQMTSIDNLQAQLAACRSQLSTESESRQKPAYRQAQQLEELRNLQDRLSQEKELWAREREEQEKELTERKSDLQRQQEQVRSEQADVRQQREQLFRKLEMLTNQGILISPNMPVVTTPGSGMAGAESSEISSHDVDSASLSSGSGLSQQLTPSPPVRKMESNKWKGPLSKPAAVPINLISAANQQKVAQNQVKQQLPLKLSKLSSSSIGSGSNSTGGSSSGMGGNAVGSLQQMLPMKLSQGSQGSVDSRRSMGSLSGAGGGSASGTLSGYHRLSSGSMSPPPPASAPVSTLIPSHARTGSSPAMMQNVSHPDMLALSSSSPHASGGPTLPGTSGGNRAGRTNTFPKIPDKFRMRSPDSNSTSKPQTHQQEEEVIFF
ncbi:rho guanine nucleotide exchange factor 18-like isoform X2 [Thrips palmi]|uniref:Rho guanine nucleotide exchange factor 18-like isoform X2 n=1 Tax=Thrips palmi TaxID=161013 RepID=A0A6P8ZR86_THRPL|nr:rho guanine nucleotide exchange factor 18-like isoform X2 [Thrips palmi]